MTNLWTPFPRLETERLSLRQVRPEDAEALYRILSDEETMRYWGCPPLTSIDEARAEVERIAAGLREGIAIRWALTLRGDDRLIGLCGFIEWRRRHRRAEISSILAPEQVGRGLAREALTAMFDYGFERMDLHSIEGGVTPGNEASAKLVERLGFRLEGHLHENYWAGNRFVDSLVYSLLARDWRARATSPKIPTAS